MSSAQASFPEAQLHGPAVGRVGGTHAHGPPCHTNEMLEWSFIAWAHGSSNGVSNQQHQPQDYLLNQKLEDGHPICVVASPPMILKGAKGNLKNTELGDGINLPDFINT